jgi:hypothetical protein
LALLSLSEANFDEIVGFRNPKSIEFESLIDFQEQIQQGGIFITRRYLYFYETSVFISLVSILIWLLRIIDLPKVGTIAGSLVETIVLVILLTVGAVVIRRMRPSETIAKELFGIEDRNE